MKSILTLIGTSALLAAVVFLIYASIAASALAFALAVLFQYIIGWVMYSLREIKIQQAAIQVRLDEERILEANSITVKCAGCNTEHRVPVVMNGRNTFKCRKCEAENVIVITTETALTTNPLDQYKDE